VVIKNRTTDYADSADGLMLEIICVIRAIVVIKNRTTDYADSADGLLLENISVIRAICGFLRTEPQITQIAQMV